MSESPDHEFSARLRKTADKLEEAMSELELLVEGLASFTDRNDQTAIMSTVIQLAHRDLCSAQAFVFRASLAQGGVIKRLLRAVLGRPLAEVPAEPEAGGEVALDPFRPQLVRCAIEVEGLFGTLSALRASIARSEIEKEVDILEWPDPVINFAGGMVAGAIENLDDARDLLYQAAELTQDGLVRLWADRVVGTDQKEEESNS